MGAVQIDVPDPFRHSIIGLAPLIFGSIAVLVIGQGWLNLTRIGTALASGDLEIIWDALMQTLTLPDIWLWLYLIFAIANGMLPSASDREAWRTVLLYIGGAVFLVVGLRLTPTLAPEFQEVGLTILSYLLSAFVITIAVDIFFMLIIFVIETFLGMILGRQLQYRR